MGEILEVGVTRSIELGDYDDVVVMEHWTPLEPDVVEEKWYARGVGMIYETKTAAARSELIEFTPGGRCSQLTVRIGDDDGSVRTMQGVEHEAIDEDHDRNRRRTRCRRHRRADGRQGVEGEDEPTTTRPRRRSPATPSSRRATPPSPTPATVGSPGQEVDDEESKYEIEVTLDNGDQVDVQLDEKFDVVGDENDGSGEDD